MKKARIAVLVSGGGTNLQALIDASNRGEIENGNWISGIKFIDNARLGDQSDLPKSMTTTGRTAFYFLPLILGLIGIFYQVKNDINNSWVVFLLFFMTGLAIVIYLAYR